MKLQGRVLVTGGTGTLGHALVYHARRAGWPVRFTVFSRSETAQAAMRRRAPELSFVLGDICNPQLVQKAVAGHNWVIHAAAGKRIPEAEEQPEVYLDVNIRGSLNVLAACCMQGVPVVGVSTDKACRAVTLYGATKLVMEKLFQAAARRGHPAFLVRYGNVVASRGSVIPIWRQQALMGQPLTVTAASATRFWMSPFDAVRTIATVINCGAPGEVFVPLMKSLTLSELASFVAPGASVLETGFRSVEKLHEDLIAPDDMVDLETLSGYGILNPASHRASVVTRHTYDSCLAPRMSREEFLNMLEEAQELEQWSSS